jgi:hypothetical protein
MAIHSDVKTAAKNNELTEDTPVRVATLNMKVAATEIRSVNKPIPGAPVGNIENNRCTKLAYLVSANQQTRIGAILPSLFLGIPDPPALWETYGALTNSQNER